MYVSKDLRNFEMIFVIIYEKPNVLSGVRVCQISMIKKNPILKGGGLLRQ